MFLIDWMLFGAEGATLGASWIISVPVSVVFAIASVFIQRYGFKDNWGLAIGKGLLIGCLTAIPSPFPSVVSVAGGILGVIALQHSDDVEPRAITDNEYMNKDSDDAY